MPVELELELELELLAPVLVLVQQPVLARRQARPVLPEASQASAPQASPPQVSLRPL